MSKTHPLKLFLSVLLALLFRQVPKLLVRPSDATQIGQLSLRVYTTYSPSRASIIEGEWWPLYCRVIVNVYCDQFAALIPFHTKITSYCAVDPVFTIHKSSTHYSRYECLRVCFSGNNSFPKPCVLQHQYRKSATLNTFKHNGWMLCKELIQFSPLPFL